MFQFILITQLDEIVLGPPHADIVLDEQVDQLFAQATKATSQDEEKRLYDQIQTLVEGDCVYAYLFRPMQLAASTNNVVLPTAKIQAEIYDALPSWTIK